MSSYNKFMDALVEIDNFCIAEMGNLIGDNKLDEFYTKIKKSMAVYKKTGGSEGLQTQLKSLEALNKQNNESSKENIIPRIVFSKGVENSGQIRHILGEASSQVNNSDVKEHIQSKMQNDQLSLSAVVKVDRLSDEALSNMGQMLPPPNLPSKLKTQKKKNEIKKETLKNIKRESSRASNRKPRRSSHRTISPIRGSEIILQNPNTEIIALDSDDETTVDVSPTRLSHSSLRQTKHTAHSTKELSQAENKMTKSKKMTRNKSITDYGSESSVYEDAVSAISIGGSTEARTKIKSIEALNNGEARHEKTGKQIVALLKEAANADPGRPRRRAFEEASQVMNEQINRPLNIKMRKSKNNQLSLTTVVKVERLSEELLSSNGQMLPPTNLPTKKKTQKKKNTDNKESLVKIKRETSTSSNSKTRTSSTIMTSPIRGSEIIIQETQVEAVALESDEEQTIDSLPTRPKRTRQGNKVDDSGKRLRSPSKDDKKTTKSKRTKRKKSIIDDASESSISAASTEAGTKSESNTSHKKSLKVSQSKKSLEKLQESPINAHKTFQINATMMVKGKKPLNETVVVDSATRPDNTMGSRVNETMAVSSKHSNGTMVVNDKVSETLFGKRSLETNIEDIMTDDESIEEQKVPKKSKLDKQFENSPVKKRVEAFEKLGAQTPVNQPIRVTRTKTRKLAQEAEEKTPISNRNIASANINMHISSDAIGPTTLSAMKASLQDFRKREQLRKEKETEATQKKKCLIEERRKKQEEKELKAKQQREAIEKDKQKVLELQKAKEDKQKLILLAKQESLKRQREENEKKRQLIKQKQEEKKREEERKRAEEERKRAEERKRTEEEHKKDKEEADRKKAQLASKQQGSSTIKKIITVPVRNNEQPKELPIYMTTVAPRLPTYDCYDSDEELPKTTAQKPLWTQRDNINASVKIMEFVEDKLKNTLFCLKPDTPDLREMFQNIDPRKLKRNSSAIWKTQPRFTIMPAVSDDEDL